MRVPCRCTPMHAVDQAILSPHPPLPGGVGTLSWVDDCTSVYMRAELCRSYLKQVREEMGRRLVSKVYDENGQPSKFWLVFAKRKFMNKAL